jgi:hypothetical protein
VAETDQLRPSSCSVGEVVVGVVVPRVHTLPSLLPQQERSPPADSQMCSQSAPMAGP